MKLKLKTETREVSAQLMQRSQIPRRYFLANLSFISKDLTHRKKTEAYLSKLIKNIWKGYGLFFYGEWGSGKTATAICVGKEVLAHYGTVLFTPASLLVKSWIEDPDTRDDMLDVDLLILDDVGIADTVFNRRVLETIIRERSDHLRSTIITANTTDPKVLGAGMLDVMGGCMIPVEVKGKKWREEEQKTIKKEILE